MRIFRISLYLLLFLTIVTPFAYAGQLTNSEIRRIFSSLWEDCFPQSDLKNFNVVSVQSGDYDKVTIEVTFKPTFIAFNFWEKHDYVRKVALYVKKEASGDISYRNSLRCLNCGEYSDYCE